MPDDQQNQAPPPLIDKPEETKSLPEDGKPVSLPLQEPQEEIEVKIPFSQSAPTPEITVEPETPPLEVPPEPLMPEAPAPEPSVMEMPFSPPAAPPVKRGPFSALKKVLIFLIAGVIVLAGGVFLFKKFAGRISKPKATTLTYWGLWEPDEAVRGVLLDWEKKYPDIKINYSQQSPKEYRERLQSALARNEGPDVFRFHISWVPMLKNELEPMPGSVMSASQFESSYYPVIPQNLKSGASILGVPLMVDTLALYYNEDIFSAAGKDPPTSWEELRQTAADLTVRDEAGQIQTAGVALGTTSNVDHWPDILGLMMLQNSADLSNPGACRKQGQEEVCLGPDALTFYTIFSQVDRVWDAALPASTIAFATGKVAMYFGPSWRVFDIKAINPNLKFKVVSVPQLPDTNISWASFWVEGVAKKSQHKAEAWEFLKYLSSPAVLEKLYQAQSNVRLFGEPYSRIDMAEKIKDNPLVSPFVEQMSNALTWYLCSNTFDNGLNDKMIKYFEDAVNAVNSGVEAKKALETTSQGVSQLLSQYGIGSFIAR